MQFLLHYEEFPYFCSSVMLDYIYLTVMDEFPLRMHGIDSMLQT